MNNRQTIGLELLNQYITSNDYMFLGAGSTSVVYTDTKWVYKILLLDAYEALSYKFHLIQTLKSIKSKFENTLFFYPISKLIEISPTRFIIVYAYEKSEPCISFEMSEIQAFLVECWQKRLIFQDIKPSNFIRVNGKLKWIDYEPDPFTDNLFLNMVVRAFIYVKYAKETPDFLKKLCRSAINQFDLVELAGVNAFVNQVFAKIIFQESSHSFPALPVNDANAIQNLAEINENGTFRLPYQDDFNPEQAFWQLAHRGLYLNSIRFETPQLDDKLYFSPQNVLIDTKKITQPAQKVSLIIKACVQDAAVLCETVKHIVRQLIFPNAFDEKILALDVKTNDFLRSYNHKNTWENLVSQAQLLVDAKIIDQYIVPTWADIEAVNQEWFDIAAPISHTCNKIPVSAQIYAFEQAQNDYILQMDCDVMIGRLSQQHAFLNDMIEEIDKNTQVLSVGFNIFKGKETTFTPYFGFENGGFVPEVRFCLLKKSRIKSLLPLKNEVIENGWKWSWYRALEMRQKETTTCSIRGGDSQSFYIHLQNFKKTDVDVWFTMLDRVEQLQIPTKQIEQFDLAGSYYDWTNASQRAEPLVVISCLRNISLSRFLRFWYSLISQNWGDWGLILIDDASDNGIPWYIKAILSPFREKITFIQNRFRVGVAQNTYKAIHYFMQNQESIVCILDADDALIGKNALQNMVEKYRNWGADVVIGKMHRTDKLHAHYQYTPNFINPRRYGGNVWQHIRSFKKYLFDSLSWNDIKIENQQKQTNDILLSKRFSHKMVFPQHCWDFAYMIPIVEMSKNPMWINHFNVLHDRTTLNTPALKQLKERIIAEILSKSPKNPKDVYKGRKTFLPNLNKIEIDLTYECNLKCINCNRSSTQAPIKEGMTIAQIMQFVEESIVLNKKWELINLLGGEPSVHKDFLEIVPLILNEYILKYAPNTILQVTSNGFGEVVQKKLAQLPKHPNLIIDYASFKDEKVIPYFSPFNDAPIDDPKVQPTEYHKGCWVTAYCGIGLNQLGYYPCGVAGGIDRIFGFGLGVQSLHEVDSQIAKYLDTFCRYCGNFTDYEKNQGDFIPRNEKAALIQPVVSNSWRKAYKNYNKNVSK